MTDLNTPQDFNVQERQSKTTVRIAIVFHSGYGHTARLATAIAKGVRSVSDAEPVLINVNEAAQKWSSLNAAQAIVFGAPTYMGSASAEFKAFQEATSREIMANGYLWKNKFAAAFTNSGARSGDKLATLFQIALFAAQHGMHWVNLDLPPANSSSTGSDDDLNRLGFWLGAGAQSNTDEGPDIAPPESDLATASHLGRRVAKTALQFAYGQGYDRNDN